MGDFKDEIAALRQRITLTDREIIGDDLQPEDTEAPWLGNYYIWYYTLGAYFKPKNVAELGVKYGYSLKSMVLGSLWGSPGRIVEVFGFDNESAVVGSTRIASSILAKYAHVGGLYVVNLRHLTDLPIRNMDLIHVDADHTVEGTYWDMCLAKKALGPKGVMIVDDFDHPTVQEGVMKFCEENGTTPQHIETFTGFAVLLPKR